jgi:hypothetical protein
MESIEILEPVETLENKEIQNEIKNKKQIRREYYEKNREKINNINREKYHKNPEKYKQYQKEYTNKNKEYINEIRNTKYKCPNCDGIYTYANYCKHILSKKHLISIKNTNPIIVPSN